MAVTWAVTYRSADVVEIVLTASADADTTSGNIPHGKGPAEPMVFLTPFLPAGGTTAVWRLSVRDGTNVAVQKAADAGSGSAFPQLTITVMRRR